ncbi:restriction endonuclease subunit S [Bacillus paranthracis]
MCHFNWKVENVNTEYMYYYFTFINIASFGMQAVKGITLNNDSINSIPIKLPSVKEQEKIAGFLAKLDMKVHLAQIKQKALQKQKQGFMQQMFI